MNKKSIVALILVFCFGALNVFGQEQQLQKNDNELVSQSETKADKQRIRPIRTLFQMSDQELDKLAIAIERIRKIPQEKRRQIAQEMDKFEKSKNQTDARKMMKKMHSHFRDEQRKILNQYFSTLDEATAKAEREAFIKMSPRERFEFMKKASEAIGIDRVPPPPFDCPPREK
ncbi:MAG: hypothetical protein K6B46_04080 [Opitutales bacterium]|nr:hypothetical protein [Opitutales bacterium]